MTLINQITKDRFNGDGVSVDFAIPFQFRDTDEIVVYLRDETDPDNVTETLKVILTDYTLTGGTTDQPVYVHFLSAPSVTQFPVIDRVTDRTQEKDYIDGDNFPADSHEDALDKLTQIAQELYGFLSRTILIPITSTLSDLTYEDPEVYGYLRWNSTATALEGEPLVASAPVVFTPATSTFSIPAATGAVDGYMPAAVYADIYAKLAALAAAGAAYVIYGTYGSPLVITSVGGISVSTDQRQFRFISSAADTSIAANPQIAAGTIIGQELRLYCLGSHTITLVNGTGLVSNGDVAMEPGASSDWTWDSTNWVLTGRNEV